MLRRLLKYRDRDDLVEIRFTHEGSPPRWRWSAWDAKTGKHRVTGPIKGYATHEEAMADAVSLLNVVGEED